MRPEFFQLFYAYGRCWCKLPPSCFFHRSGYGVFCCRLFLVRNDFIYSGLGFINTKVVPILAYNLVHCLLPHSPSCGFLEFNGSTDRAREPWQYNENIVVWHFTHLPAPCWSCGQGGRKRPPGAWLLKPSLSLWMCIRKKRWKTRKNHTPLGVWVTGPEIPKIVTQPPPI